MKYMFIGVGVIITGCMVAHSLEKSLMEELEELMKTAALDIYYIDGLTNEREKSAAINLSPANTNEVVENLKGIKTAELAYESYFDTFVSAEIYPPTEKNNAKRAWKVNESGGFRTMGWGPDNLVKGSYWVTTTTTDFTAYGIIDVEGDGSYATYTATKSENPKTPVIAEENYELTSRQRKKLIKNISSIYTQIKNSKELESDPNVKRITEERIIDFIVITAYNDEDISSNERKVIQLYIDEISSEYSLEQSLDVMKKEAEHIKSR
jgi:hypothetical protein